jgi:hypothetical protein
MLWYGDWQFMYAGAPANFAMVSEEIEIAGMENPESISRRHVQETVRRAYRKVCSRLASSESLNPFDMTMDQFKANGLKSFGQEFHSELLRRIDQKGAQVNEQLLVTGWGQSPHSVMVYEVGPSGDWLHTAAGFAAIGSGSQMAQTMLLLLGQARYRTLAETIFNVACAKFSSEKSSGLDVGQTTTMYVSRKRTPEDDPHKVCGSFVADEDIDKLRGLWEEHLKPRIPDEARIEITAIAGRVNDSRIEVPDMVALMKARRRLNEKHAAINSEGSINPQQTTPDPSDRTPSQG